ncbi:carbohydrate-binding module family 18 protein [Piromyces sp. E2]|nr:carbohydrate-binding module family 18 protein [Piromyces sp. E2]|eukprot:OUM57813.1 carbohydrate-binding module family 18 protein [Piromyces sp. E2]
MKVQHILLVFTIFLVVTKAYDIKCKSYYETVEGDSCINVSLKNGVSFYRLGTLNQDIDCKKLKSGTKVCIEGRVNISKSGTCGNGKGSCPFGECCSKDGTCGTSSKHCGTGCNPNYGICENISDSINGFEIETINDIMKNLNMTKSQARQFFKYGNEVISYYADAFKSSVDNRLSLKQCKQMCNKANKKFVSLSNNKNNIFTLKTYNKYLKSHGEAAIDYEFLLNICESKCYAIKEIDENKDKYSSNKLVKAKRDDDTCEPASQGRISLVTSNYKNGVPQYKQDNGSAETGIVLVNGCSIPLLQNLYNSDDYGLFVPVCNSHDLCYTCQVAKNTCDNRFLNNMKDLCQIYDKWWQYLTDYLSCIGEAELFYAAVSYGGQSAYDACVIYNNSPNCALCGTRIIQDSLLENSFYVKK